MKYSLPFVSNIAAKHLEVHLIDFVGSGDHSEAFCLNENLVIKLPKHQEASDGLKTEIHILRVLGQKMPLEVPTVLFDGIFSADGKDFVYSISKRLRGKNLSRTEFLALDNSTTTKNAELIAKFLFCLHHKKQALPIRGNDLCLLHGDFSLNHVLFDENNLACGVLDFGDSRVGKPMEDFIYLLDNEDDEEFGDKFGEMVLNRYRKFNG